MRKKRMQARMRFETILDVGDDAQGRGRVHAASRDSPYERNRPATPPCSRELPWRATLLLLSSARAR